MYIPMTENTPQAALVSKFSKMASAGKSVEDMTAMYMREMSTGELLDRDGEIEIGKRMEKHNQDIRTVLLKFPNNIETVLNHYDDVVNNRQDLKFFAVGIYEPYEYVAVANEGDAPIDKNESAEVPEIESPELVEIDFEDVRKYLDNAKVLFDEFESSVSSNGIGHDDQGPILTSIAESLRDLEFHPDIVGQLIYNIDAINSSRVIGGMDGGVGMRDYERALADIAINKCNMSRPDFISSFPGRETDPTWIDEQIQKGGKSGFYFNMAQDDFRGYQKRLEAISERAMLPISDIKENNSQLNQFINNLQDTKNEMIEANLRLVVAFANKYSNYSNNFLDLVQEGNVGLMRSVERFDYRRGYKFSTYATNWVKKGVIDFLNQNTYTSRLPGHIVDGRRAINKAGEAFYKEHGREASLNDIVEATGFSTEKIAEISEAVSRSSSLDAPITEGEGASMIDLVEDSHTVTPESLADKQSMNDVLSKAIEKLSVREAKVVSMRFGVNMPRNYTASEVADELNITEERVREVETKAMRKLRHPSLSTDLKESFDAIQSPGRGN